MLEEPFRGCSLYEAVPFLRLCYRPQDVTQAHLAGERASLPALLRLAHKLDAGRILEQVVMHMTGESKVCGNTGFEGAAAHGSRCVRQQLCSCDHGGFHPLFQCRHLLHICLHIVCAFPLQNLPWIMPRSW